MQFRLATLIGWTTAVCVALAFSRYEIATSLALGLPLILGVKELVLFGRDLQQPN